MSAATPDQDSIIEFFGDAHIATSRHPDSALFALVLILALLLTLATALALTFLLVNATQSLLMAIAEWLDSCIRYPWPIGDGRLVCP
ncbi:MAG: hypothetical protein B5766_10260 [Candidatus Lumbricidophila eiseniae]|uniref:Uncharacterized protein n=1 Tax=Candidatus Lumbricidiphila eiseniae TaxID=1969409 RepID=A0A2A6FPG0_9MICO|nr:MAG: hypothetical protein B5766_10260 [Candidatus Lumbricidophila eiseniae]